MGLLLLSCALRCDSIARLWHERDNEGALLPDPTLRYELGQWAWYVGVLPDQASPGGVQPVWGSAEQLHLHVDRGGRPPRSTFLGLPETC